MKINPQQSSELLMSQLAEVPDDCFVLLTETLAEFSRQIEHRTGEKPSMALLCEFLAAGVRSCSTDILSDTSCQALGELRPKLVGRVRRIKPVRGDIAAVPRPKGGFYLMVYLGHLHPKGHGWGLLAGHRPIARLKTRDNLSLGFRFPVFTDLQPFLCGRWRIIGNRTDTADLFQDIPLARIVIPRDYTLPEHETRYGAYGFAIHAGGTEQALSHDDAKDLGILSKEYRNSVMDAAFEQLLAKRLG